MKRKPAPDDDEVLTYEEAAALAKVSRRSFERWVNEGRVAVLRPPGSRPRVRRGDLLDFLFEYRVSPVGETAPVKA
jgi:excisionase family DNA binding protein